MTQYDSLYKVLERIRETLNPESDHNKSVKIGKVLLIKTDLMVLLRDWERLDKNARLAYNEKQLLAQVEEVAEIKPGFQLKWTRPMFADGLAVGDKLYATVRKGK